MITDSKASVAMATVPHEMSRAGLLSKKRHNTLQAMPLELKHHQLRKVSSSQHPALSKNKHTGASSTLIHVDRQNSDIASHRGRSAKTALVSHNKDVVGYTYILELDQIPCS
jgi:hypothetical protein